MSSGNYQEDEAKRLLGTVLSGKWRLDSLIGQGGMASVYAATHRNGRRAAIKLLKAEFSRNTLVRDRFLREGYVANHIGHPGVVGILDDDVTELGQVYLVMELLEGDSFHARIRARSLSSAQILFIGQQVLEPLATAHRRGVIHRDIKPANVFVCSDGRVKVLDFGLARVMEGNDLEPTRDGLVLGTPAFLSPEQARAKRDDIDWRADLYSVGAMLFYALSGRCVHEGESELKILMSVMKKPAPPLVSVWPVAPAKVAALVDRALRFDPAERWQCAEDMAAATAEAFHEMTGMAIPATARVDSQDKKGWTRAAVNPAANRAAAPSTEMAEDDFIPISMVFEPDTQVTASGASDPYKTPPAPLKR